MGLNAKDRTLDALNKYVDKPTPLTVRPGVYQASNPYIKDGDVVVDFTIAEIQSSYLRYVFGGGVRHPGDPGTTAKRIWLPTFANGSKDKYGGLTPEFIKKLAGLIDRNKKGKGAGRSVHYEFATLKAHGHKAAGGTAQIDDVKADAQFDKAVDITKIAFGHGGEARSEQPDPI